MPVLGYGGEDAVLAANIELEMGRKGKTARRTDAMIAAVTMNNKASLCTLDVKHFKPMGSLGLKLFR